MLSFRSRLTSGSLNSLHNGGNFSQVQSFGSNARMKLLKSTIDAVELICKKMVEQFNAIDSFTARECPFLYSLCMNHIWKLTTALTIIIFCYEHALDSNLVSKADLQPLQQKINSIVMQQNTLQPELDVKSVDPLSLNNVTSSSKCISNSDNEKIANQPCRERKSLLFGDCPIIM